MSLEARFWSKVAFIPEHPCLEWTASKGPGGYGHLYVDGTLMRAHRIAWELEYGPIPDGFEVMHVACDNPGCVRVSHLAIGSHADNMADMKLKGRARTNDLNKRTHCKYGHEFTPENTYHPPGHPTYRRCLACDALSHERSGRRRRGLGDDR